MKILSRTRHPKLVALLSLGASALAFAAAVFIPSTQPTVILGKYVLKDADLFDGGTIAYRPWFENGAWQGDIIEYQINEDGTRVTDASVSATAPASGTSGLCGRPASGCWSARATFIAKGADDVNGTYWQNRNIITTNGTAQIPFTWDNLTATQRAALDQDTVDLIAAGTDPTLTDSNSYASVILNYILGERINERINDGFLRTRYSVLGDITNTPAYIGPPRELLANVTGYSTFASNNVDREGRIAAGSGDGMLHIFKEDDGSEVFAYIPSMVIGKLGRLAARYEAYQHTYFVDGEPNVNSAQIGPDWHTILAGGGGAGFAGLYALDMTDPDFGPNKILFEKTAADGFGHIYGKPQIAPLGNDNADPDWYIITGNGYSTASNHPTKLMFISLDDTDNVYEVPIGGVSGGLSAPALVSTDSDDMPELAFAGDIKGDLWMFEINQDSPGSSTVTKVYDGSIDQPITGAPVVGEHPSEEGFLVFFGTGSILSMDDALNDGVDNQGNFTQKQAVRGIWVDTSDMTALKAGLPYKDSNCNGCSLQTQSLAETVYPATGQLVRYVPTENPVNYRCPIPSVSCTLHKGWKVELPNCGERLVGDPFLRAGRLQFVTNNPTGLNCGERTLEGDAWVMSLDYTMGSDNGEIAYNLNNDSALDDLDTVAVGSPAVNKPPVGLNLGPGNISQPAFARLREGVDKMYINGLLLSVPIPNPGPILGGHLDVETDSPSDGVIAVNEVSKHSEGYMVKVNDGLGGAVDGHIHDYDGIHGVNFVDLFQLEPRRGKASLVATLADVNLAAGEPCDSTTPNKKGTLVDGQCLELLEGELNRAYDTLHTDADGVMHPNNGPDGADGQPTPMWQSEVNSLGTDADFVTAVPDKKFIVTLANADLSNAGVLQIGCKVWPVVEYQNMVTSQLQGMTGGSVSGLVDEDGDSLIFSLADIMDDDPSTCPGGANAPDEEIYSKEFAVAKGLSPTPTLRIGFGIRSILDTGIHPTRSQCVLGLHNPVEKICYTDQEVLTAAEDKFPLGVNYKTYTTCNGLFPSTPPDNYLRDPADNLHITYIEGKGFRWRNGALTLQLIDAGIDPAADLQDPGTMVDGAGTFARAFTVTGSNFTNQKSAFPDGNSGMLYETTMFWHYSVLVDRLRNEDPDNNPTPPEGGCYNGPGYNGKSVIDNGGTNPAETNELVDDLNSECPGSDTEPCRLDQFLALLQMIGNAETEEELNQALLDLANLLAAEGNEDLKKLYDLWDYIPEDEKPQLGDEGQSRTIADGTPADVVSIETIDLEARGPNFIFGRRNWIDIRQ